MAGRYTGQHETLESQTISVHRFLVEIKLLKEEVLIIQVAPSILATGQDCWADVLGRSTHTTC